MEKAYCPLTIKKPKAYCEKFKISGKMSERQQKRKPEGNSEIILFYFIGSGHITGAALSIVLWIVIANQKV